MVSDKFSSKNSKFLQRMYGSLTFLWKGWNQESFQSRLCLIVWVNVVLNRTVKFSSRQSLSTTTVLFRTTFTQTIKCNLLLINFFATQQFRSFWWLICPSILLAKSWKLHNLISSFNFCILFMIYGVGSYELSHMLKRKNVNNDVSKDSPL